MPSPFPGMDPYLEQPDGWPNVHNSLITAIRDELQAHLRPRYWVAIEERVYLSETGKTAGSPDAIVVDTGRSGREPGVSSTAVAHGVEVYVPSGEVIRETFLEIRTVAQQHVITVLEILSPSNKRAGMGRDTYLEKRGRILGSRVSLVEIDLLREGYRMPSLGGPAPYQYGVLVCRYATRPRAMLYPFGVRDPIPMVPLPLEGEEELALPLQEIFASVYDRGGFDLVTDYTAEPVPPLPAEDAVWADALLRGENLR